MASVSRLIVCISNSESQAPIEPASTRLVTLKSTAEGQVGVGAAHPFALLKHLLDLSKTWPSRIELLWAEITVGDPPDYCPNRIVAIKSLKVRHSSRLRQGARAIAGSNYPKIHILYDVGSDYLVVEDVGQDPKVRLPPKDALQVAVNIGLEGQSAEQRRDQAAQKPCVRAASSTRRTDRFQHLSMADSFPRFHKRKPGAIAVRLLVTSGRRQRVIVPSGRISGPGYVRTTAQFHDLSSLLRLKPLGATFPEELTTQTIGGREKLAGLIGVNYTRPQQQRAAPPEMFPTFIGRTISHYRIAGTLGSGGMGVVYRAQDLRLRRPVALKFGSNNTLTRQDLRECMLHEAQAGSALQHPNVCSVYDVGEFQGLPFVVMELMEGQTLKERIRKPLTLERFLYFAIQIADGLAAVHSKGIVHRDIKPSNIFITNADHAKIFDFSLAMIARPVTSNHVGRYSTARSAWPGSSGVMGTPFYMSPEHIRDEPLDGRTDLFSLGVVFYEMLTGCQRREGITVPKTTELASGRSLESISARRRDLPSSLTDLLERALESDREFRCQTAAEVRADLKRVQRDLGLGGGAR